jgi:cytochrome c556
MLTERTQWFHDRKVYLDALENQLRALLKAMETMVGQRKMMAEAAGDFSASLHALSTVELSPTLSGPLDALSELQLTIRDVYDRQAQQDVLTFGIILEEYIRLIGSVKQAFGQRQKAFYSWHSAESELQKKKATQDKLLRQGKSQQDRLNQVGAEVGEAERKCHHARLLFEDMGRLMRVELDRFEREKVEDFKSGVETFLESAVEAQKEVRGTLVLLNDSSLTCHSSSRNGRRSSCSSMPRTTRLCSTARPPLSRRPASPRATRPSTALGRPSTTTRISKQGGGGLRSHRCPSRACPTSRRHRRRRGEAAAARRRGGARVRDEAEAKRAAYGNFCWADSVRGASLHRCEMGGEKALVFSVFPPLPETGDEIYVSSMVWSCCCCCT